MQTSIPVTLSDQVTPGSASTFLGKGWVVIGNADGGLEAKRGGLFRPPSSRREIMSKRVCSATLGKQTYSSGKAF